MARSKKSVAPPAAHLLALSGELTIYQAAQLQALLRDALAAAQLAGVALQLDLAATSECDGAGLQLLLATARSASAAAVPLALQGVPANLQALLDTYHVADQFKVAA